MSGILCCGGELYAPTLLIGAMDPRVREDDVGKANIIT
jgi:hypothetical protein